MKEIIWIPKKRVGPFHFNMIIQEYQNYPLILIKDEDPKLGWDGYRLNEKDMLIYTEKGKIVSISCYQECIYKGVNLIGLEFNKAMTLLDRSPTDHDIMELDDGIQDVFEFDDLCLQLWVKNRNVVTAILSSDV